MFNIVPAPVNPRFNNLTNRRFGRWTVIGYLGTQKNSSKWLCKCDCGTLKDVLGKTLVNNSSKSCGCYKKEVDGSHCIKHGHATKGMSSEYRSWTQMKSRCYSLTCPDYLDYGGRGITVHGEWINDFQAFYSYMGPKPTPQHSIDRYPDNDGDYVPGNVRWATKKEQTDNRYNTVKLTYKGKSKSLKRWCEELNINYTTAQHRLHSGFCTECTLSEEKFSRAPRSCLECK